MSAGAIETTAGAVDNTNNSDERSTTTETSKTSNTPNTSNTIGNGNESLKVDIPTLVKLIPRHCFNKSLLWSLFYMFRDLLLLSTSLYTWNYLNDSFFGLLLFWNIYGFIMWCIFVVGHDCGHGSFSDYKFINDICGHICHMLLFVPYWPWAYSHRKHHMYHNHKDKDHSHPWYTTNEWENGWLGYGLISLPFTAFFGYLYIGLFDGTHLFPFTPISLYRNEKRIQPKIECIISNLINIIFGYGIYKYFTLEEIFYGYIPCWIMFSFWLFMVTYLQHHDEREFYKTKIYNDNTFNFHEAAFETVDREYGFGIDDFHHNITDGHVVHHLFYTKIPHYNLKDATIAIKPYLNKCGKYKYIKHDGNFFIDLYKGLFKTHFTGEMRTE